MVNHNQEFIKPEFSTLDDFLTTIMSGDFSFIDPVLLISFTATALLLLVIVNVKW